jgi:hypothetical protein
MATPYSITGEFIQDDIRITPTYYFNELNQLDTVYCYVSSNGTLIANSDIVYEESYCDIFTYDNETHSIGDSVANPQYFSDGGDGQSDPGNLPDGQYKVPTSTSDALVVKFYISYIFDPYGTPTSKTFTVFLKIAAYDLKSDFVLVDTTTYNTLFIFPNSNTVANNKAIFIKDQCWNAEVHPIFIRVVNGGRIDNRSTLTLNKNGACLSVFTDLINYHISSNYPSKDPAAVSTVDTTNSNGAIAILNKVNIFNTDGPPTGDSTTAREEGINSITLPDSTSGIGLCSIVYAGSVTGKRNLYPLGIIDNDGNIDNNPLYTSTNAPCIKTGSVSVVITGTLSPDSISVISATGIEPLLAIIFSNSFNGVVAGTIYYVGFNYIVGSTTVPLSLTSDGFTPLSLTTLRVSSNALAVVGPNDIIIDSVNGLQPGLPITFDTSFSGLVSNTRYYAGSGYNQSRQVQLSSTSGGNQLTSKLQQVGIVLDYSSSSSIDRYSTVIATYAPSCIVLDDASGITTSSRIIPSTSFNGLIADTTYQIHEAYTSGKIIALRDNSNQDISAITTVGINTCKSIINIVQTIAPNTIIIESPNGLDVGMPIIVTDGNSYLSNGTYYASAQYDGSRTLTICSDLAGNTPVTLSDSFTYLSQAATLYQTMDDSEIRTFNITSTIAPYTIIVDNASEMSFGTYIKVSNSFNQLVAGTNYYVGNVSGNYIELTDVNGDNIANVETISGGISGYVKNTLADKKYILILATIAPNIIVVHSAANISLNYTINATGNGLDGDYYVMGINGNFISLSDTESAPDIPYTPSTVVQSSTLVSGTVSIPVLATIAPDTVVLQTSGLDKLKLLKFSTLINGISEANVSSSYDGSRFISLTDISTITTGPIRSVMRSAILAKVSTGDGSKSSGIVLFTDQTAWYIVGWYDPTNWIWDTSIPSDYMNYFDIPTTDTQFALTISANVSTFINLPPTPSEAPHFILSKFTFAIPGTGNIGFSGYIRGKPNIFNDNGTMRIYWDGDATNRSCIWFVSEMRIGESFNRYYPILSYCP